MEQQGNKENKDPKKRAKKEFMNKRKHMHFDLELTAQVAADAPEKWEHSAYKD